MIDKKKLDWFHRNVPVDHYQKGIEKNIFQKYWHGQRFPLIIGELKKLNLSGPILDIGCHSGDLTRIVKDTTGSKVVALDISEKAIGYAKKRFDDIDFIVCDFPNQADFADNYFQAVTAFDIMEHIPDLDKFLDYTRRIMISGGYFIITIPNETFMFKLAWYLWLKLKGEVWKEVHVHDFTKEGLQIFEQKGFKKIVDKKLIFNMYWFLIFKLEK